MRAKHKRLKPDSKKRAEDVRFISFVEHPKYGHAPRYTNLNPSPSDPGVRLHHSATKLEEIRECLKRLLGRDESNLLLALDDHLALCPSKPVARIAGTAIEAHVGRQVQRPVPVTHYFDVEKVCLDCKRPFIFFALEQMHWYEDLQFPPEADCVRCPKCRKKEQALARKRREYEHLVKLSNRDWKDGLKLAECAATLIEAGVFTHRTAERAQAALKRIPKEQREKQPYQRVAARVKLLLKG